MRGPRRSIRRWGPALAVFPYLAATAGVATAADWPQAAATAARTGAVADGPAPPFQLAWTKTWPGEVLSPVAQPVVLGQTGYLASENGIVHAFQLPTGEDRWATDLGAPVLHTLAGDGPHVFAADTAGRLTALDGATGKVLWQTRLSRRGFSAAPLLLDGLLVIGCRDGVVYAVRAATGEVSWRTDTGAPVTQTAAGDQGRIVLVNDALRVFCLEAPGGEVAWTAGPLPGPRIAYWPVIAGGRVIIALPELGRPNELQQRLFWPVEYNRPVERVSFKARTVEDMIREQDIFLDFLKAHPEHRRLFVFDLATGHEPVTPSVIRGASENGEPVAATADGRSGRSTRWMSSSGTSSKRGTR